MPLERKEKIKVLFIDDELNNLNSFKASFRLNYHVLVAISAKEALEILKSDEDIVAIISDHRMPEKTGVEFFEEIRYTFPKPIRMLATAYTDIESVVDSINKGNIFRYIRKPWVEEDIISAIEEAYKYYLATSLLIRKNEELQIAYNELDKFSYSIAHDLRGPITSVKSALMLVRGEISEDTRSELIDLMAKSLQKLDDLVGSIFDYYKLKQGELNISRIDFKSILKDQEDIHGVTAKMNGVHFEYHLDQEMDFWSDEMKIRIIIHNLLSNALKYQKPDETTKMVKLDISVKNGNAIIRVIDNGIGIPEHFIHNIFDIFFRATTKEPGSGIGLFNVKDSLLKLNGSIHVQSKENIGSEFILTIPSK